MHYDGTTFRPPYEAYSLLLQVTTGCSHNGCTFCSMYQDVPFAVSPLDEIVDDIVEASRFRPNARRVFLENGDAFCLPAQALLNIAEMIREALPQVTSIGCYARIPNIASKTDGELAALAAAGYSDINIGVESGLDSVLSFMNKGYTVAEAREQFARLHAAGLPFNVNIINAAAGPSRIAEHAVANAALANDAKPTLVFVSPLHVDPGSRLEALVARGDFEECTLGQYLEEEIAFLEGLELDDCVFFGLHVSNPVPVQGLLPRDKNALLAALRNGLAGMPQALRDSHPSKGAEGSLR